MSSAAETNVSTSNILVVPTDPLPRSATIKQPTNLGLILSICGEALKHFGDQPINGVKILILIQHVIIAVKKLTKLNEEDQKKLVMDAVHWLIENQKGLTDEEKNTLDILSETVFIQAIEILSNDTNCFCFSKK